MAQIHRSPFLFPFFTTPSAVLHNHPIQTHSFFFSSLACASRLYLSRLHSLPHVSRLVFSIHPIQDEQLKHEVNRAFADSL